MDSFRHRVAIAGVGETDYSTNSGRSELVLALQAITAALDDAGIDRTEVDGLMKWSVDTSSEGEIASNLGVRDLAWFGEVNQAGNVGAPLVAHAASAIAAGLASVVVIYRGVNGRSGRRYGRGDVTGRRGQGGAAFTEPFGLLTPQHSLAMTARRRMHEFGTTSRQFGYVSVSEREHANRNPRATFYEKPLTIEEHQSSRLIVEPFHLYDCCLETDGGGAIVLTSAERARDLKQPPALIRTAAQYGGGRGRAYVDTAAAGLAPRFWRQAEVAPGEVDVVQIYDHFAPYVIFALEDYGFVERGEGGPFVESGGIRWDGGALPVNTSGGHLSEAYMQGMNHLIEATRQVRGQSTAQVEDCHLSFVDTGVGTGAVLLERAS
ncbi:MAG: lipid-transfer protein [Dehalococcoidia bacterium]|nr:lipid-transfer protein [Dehalococcoidia bacterium]